MAADGIEWHALTKTGDEVTSAVSTEIFADPLIPPHTLSVVLLVAREL
jgi:hypothetical protein